MRYQWFQDVPRNVPKREYQQLQFLNFCAIGLGLTSTMLAIGAVTGLTMQTSRELAQVDTMSIVEAATYEGDRIDLIKLEGYLVADEAPAMPDDEARKVIRGALTLSARGDADSGSPDSDEPLRETLFEWEDSVDAVFLSDGDERIPLAFDLAVLPMAEESHDEVSPRIIRAGDSARTSRPVAVEYGDRTFPLSSDVWGNVDSVFTDLERRVLPHGQAVVVVAGLDTTTQGTQLIDPLGDRLRIELGTEDEIRQQGQQARLMFGILWIPLGLGSYFVGRSAHRLRQEFIERSNQ